MARLSLGSHLQGSEHAPGPSTCWSMSGRCPPTLSPAQLAAQVPGPRHRRGRPQRHAHPHERPGEGVPLRGSSILPSDVTGKQTAKYAIKRSPLQFTINDVSYDPTSPRLLKFDATEEWEVWSDPDSTTAIPVPHPFHIHTNLFEVFSITNRASGQETLAEAIWRDTVILKPGERVGAVPGRVTRISPETSSSTAHILDHEDQGMMQLIRVSRLPRRAGGP